MRELAYMPIGAGCNRLFGSWFVIYFFVLGLQTVLVATLKQVYGKESLTSFQDFHKFKGSVCFVSEEEVLMGSTLWSDLRKRQNEKGKRR